MARGATPTDTQRTRCQGQASEIEGGDDMRDQHLPALGPRFWAALCLASIFGANMGDFFAHNIGLGHVAGLPFLAVGFALVMTIERFDRMAHETYYWLGIILVR